MTTAPVPLPCVLGYATMCKECEAEGKCNAVGDGLPLTKRGVRAAFEAWALKTHSRLALDEPDTGSMWSAWQAARNRPGAMSSDTRAYISSLVAERDELRQALAGLVDVISAAGLYNLSRGVVLGPTVWYVKASAAIDAARKALEPR
jgi:hypothetical protein